MYEKNYGGFPKGQGSEEDQGKLLYSRYNEYVCYPPRDNGEIAIPTWELTDKHLNDLSRRYIIAEDFSPEDMKTKIKDIMYPIVEHVIQGNHEGFCFSIPDNENLEYNDALCFPLLKRGGKAVKRDFYSGTSTHTAAKTAWTMKTVYENLCSGFVPTLRDVHYRHSLLFKNQEALNRTVTDLCYIFGCTRRSLNVTSEQRGYVCGKSLKLNLNDGTILDCSRKTYIPDDTQITNCSFDEETKYILVVEKGTIFNYLENLKFHDVQSCIIMTSSGFPDVFTRRFLKLIQKATKLPVIGVADPDPSGIEIMRCYSQGSASLSLENFNLAVPSLRWVGVSLSDIEERGITLTNFNSEKLSGKDRGTLESLKSDQYTKLGPRWKHAVDKMLAVGRKTSFEVMHERGFNYVAHTFLPEIISRALVIEATQQ